MSITIPQTPQGIDCTAKCLVLNKTELLGKKGKRRAKISPLFLPAAKATFLGSRLKISIKYLIMSFGLDAASI